MEDGLIKMEVFYKKNNLLQKRTEVLHSWYQKKKIDFFKLIYIKYFISKKR